MVKAFGVDAAVIALELADATPNRALARERVAI